MQFHSVVAQTVGSDPVNIVQDPTVTTKSAVLRTDGYWNSFVDCLLCGVELNQVQLQHNQFSLSDRHTVVIQTISKPQYIAQILMLK